MAGKQEEAGFPTFGESNGVSYVLGAVYNDCIGVAGQETLAAAIGENDDGGSIHVMRSVIDHGAQKQYAAGCKSESEVENLSSSDEENSSHIDNVADRDGVHTMDERGKQSERHIMDPSLSDHRNYSIYSVECVGSAQRQGLRDGVGESDRTSSADEREYVHGTKVVHENDAERREGAGVEGKVDDGDLLSFDEGTPIHSSNADDESLERRKGKRLVRARERGKASSVDRVYPDDGWGPTGRRRNAADTPVEDDDGRLSCSDKSASFDRSSEEDSGTERQRGADTEGGKDDGHISSSDESTSIDCRIADDQGPKKQYLGVQGGVSDSTGMGFSNQGVLNYNRSFEGKDVSKHNCSHADEDVSDHNYCHEDEDVACRGKRVGGVGESDQGVPSLSGRVASNRCRRRAVEDVANIGGHIGRACESDRTGSSTSGENDSAQCGATDEDGASRGEGMIGGEKRGGGSMSYSCEGYAVPYVRAVKEGMPQRRGEAIRGSDLNRGQRLGRVTGIVGLSALLREAKLATQILSDTSAFDVMKDSKKLAISLAEDVEVCIHVCVSV